MFAVFFLAFFFHFSLDSVCLQQCSWMNNFNQLDRGNVFVPLTWGFFFVCSVCGVWRKLNVVYYVCEVPGQFGIASLCLKTVWEFLPQTMLDYLGSLRFFLPIVEGDVGWFCALENMHFLWPNVKSFQAHLSVNISGGLSSY